MKQINYSIIIPHYNIPELLIRCLNTIPLRDDTEILIVDDCSENFRICKERIKEMFSQYHLSVYSTEKQSGPGIARNVGLDHAVGKWILFEDADDFFSENLNEVLDLCKDRKEDILFFHSRSVRADDVGKSADDYMYEDILLDFAKNRNESALRYKFYSACGRLIRRSLIESNGIRFDGRSHGEDLLFSVRIGHKCRSLDVLPYCLDMVTCRSGSLSRSWKDWSEWYEQFFPAHVDAMHELHKDGCHAIDDSVYGKLFTLLKLDFSTFKRMLSLLCFSERIKFFGFIIGKAVAMTIRKIGARMK